MSARHRWDTHLNLQACFTGTHESISAITSSGNNGSIFGGTIVETPASSELEISDCFGIM
jgi:hypothetical protein